MAREKSEVVIGTSGYSFDDWEGEFYPVGLPKGKRLDFYKDHFKAVEINSTYYRIPHPAVFYNMVKKVGEDFEFVVKTHRSFTHDRDDLENKSHEYNEAVKPIIESGRLKGYIAQFPYSFKYSQEGLDYILRGTDYFSGAPLFVEFRNSSWDRQEVYQALSDEGIGFCAVDEPQLAGLFPPKALATIDIGYIRLHGRNGAKWWSGGGERYDYLYSEKELKEWKNKIEDLKSKTNKIYLFFNNCHLGQAVRNAKMFMEMMQTELSK